MLFVHGGHSVRRLSVKQSKQSKTLGTRPAVCLGPRNRPPAPAVGEDVEATYILKTAVARRFERAAARPRPTRAHRVPRSSLLPVHTNAIGANATLAVCHHPPARTPHPARPDGRNRTSTFPPPAPAPRPPGHSPGRLDPPRETPTVLLFFLLLPKTPTFHRPTAAATSTYPNGATPPPSPFILPAPAPRTPGRSPPATSTPPRNQPNCSCCVVGLVGRCRSLC